MKSQLLPDLAPICPESVGHRMLPSEAQKTMQSWIRSRHLICSSIFFVFETVDYIAIGRFSECVSALGGTHLSVEPIDKIWLGNHREVFLYRARACLNIHHHALNQYWLKYGSFRLVD